MTNTRETCNAVVYGRGRIRRGDNQWRDKPSSSVSTGSEDEVVSVAKAIREDVDCGKDEHFLREIVDAVSGVGTEACVRVVLTFLLVWYSASLYNGVMKAYVPRAEDRL